MLDTYPSLTALRAENGGSVRWRPLAAWVAVTAVLSLSVHVIMLDVMGIPHPDNSHVGAAAVLFNLALSVIATIALYRVAHGYFARFSLVVQCLLLTAIYAMLGEALLRNFIMDVVVSHDWIYCLVENLPRPVECFCVCVMIVVGAPRLRKPWMIVAAGTLIATIAVVAIDPAIEALAGRLTASIEYLDTGNIYNPPYGWQVDVPSYLTWLEPVIACYAIAALTLRAPPPAWRRWQFVVLIMAMKGSIVPTLLYSFYQPRPWPAAVLSESQFALEVLAMAVLTAIGWELTAQRAAGRSRGAEAINP